MATYRKMLKDKDGNNIIPAGFVDAMYPIGSIYISATMSTAAQVQTAFGGTWVAWGEGKVPVGVDSSQTEFNTVEKTGGEKTHTLTITEMPSHNHNVRSGFEGGKNDQLGYNHGFGSPAGYRSGGDGGNFIEDKGGGAAHNNLQPYITCYMYKRTA